MNFYEFLADLILYFHLLYVLGVIVPIPLIFLGAWLNWKWIRVRRIRQVHLGMMLFVAVEALIGMVCPLTEWEAKLRAQSSSASFYPEGFLASWVSRILFSDFDTWVYTLVYVFTALLIIDLYILIPPTKNLRDQRLAAET